MPPYTQVESQEGLKLQLFKPLFYPLCLGVVESQEGLKLFICSILIIPSSSRAVESQEGLKRVVDVAVAAPVLHHGGRISRRVETKSDQRHGLGGISG